MTRIEVWKVPPSHGSGMAFEKVRIEPEPDSLNAASAGLPAGAYTTFRTFGGDKTLPLGPHFNRLEESARLAQAPITLNREGIRSALRQAASEFPSPEKRIRVTLDLADRPGTIYFSIEALQTPTAEEYRQGAWAVTIHLQRQLPQAKLTDFIAVADSVRSSLPPDANEALLVDPQGEIQEGLSSNFFAVKDGQVYTAGEAVLPGITRSLVLDQAQQLGLPLHFQSALLTEVPSLQEAFLTSSSRSVLPLRQIDDTVIGQGVPGPVTRKLMQRYEEKVDSQLERI